MLVKVHQSICYPYVVNSILAQSSGSRYASPDNIYKDMRHMVYNMSYSLAWNVAPGAPVVSTRTAELMSSTPPV